MFLVFRKISWEARGGGVTSLQKKVSLFKVQSRNDSFIIGYLRQPKKQDK
jgi:hypothetical protein